MGVDIVDIRRLQPCILQRRAHGAFATLAVLGRRGDVVGVAGQAVAFHLGINLRAARLGMFVILKHDNTRALAHDKPVAVGVIGAAGRLGIVRAFGGQRLAGIETGDTDLANRRFRTARDHHIRVAELDQPRGVANRMGTGGTGGDNRVVRPFEAIADADLTGDQVDQRAGDKERRHAARPLFLDKNGGVGDGGQPANPRPDHHTRAQPTFLVLRCPPGILHRHLGGGDTIKDKGVDLALFLWRQPVVGVERAVGSVAMRHFAGIGRAKVARVKARDRPRTGLSGQKTAPRFLDPAGQRCDQTQTGNDNSAHDDVPCP